MERLLPVQEVFFLLSFTDAEFIRLNRSAAQILQVQLSEREKRKPLEPGYGTSEQQQNMLTALKQFYVEPEAHVKVMFAFH